MNVPVRITENIKGHRRLIYGGNIFIKHAEMNGKTHWKCLLARSYKCKAKISTLNSNKQTGMVKELMHTHGLEAFKKRQMLLNKQDSISID